MLGAPGGNNLEITHVLIRLHTVIMYLMYFALNYAVLRPRIFCEINNDDDSHSSLEGVPTSQPNMR